MLAAIADRIHTLESSSTHKYSPKPTDPTNMVPANRRSPPLDGGNFMKIGCMWTLKHEIRSP